VSERIGLSGATLVQRFGTKQRLIDAAIARGWVGLEQRTQQFAREEPKTPAGAVAILSRLSRDYGDIDSYADKLQLLREDLRNPAFRARGKAWVDMLSVLLQACFAEQSDLPEDFGRLMLAQWQGALVLWAFAPEDRLDSFIGEHLERYLRAQSRWDE
jgi:AcrR family transcriptional regulator